GKAQSRVGRKMAHVTVLTDAPNDDVAVADIVKTVEGLWY
ncbi:MAG: 5-(carboxyamino)imidazole ribonucleotide synthase, partial [Cyanobacteria bacterium J06598_3]